uniref:CC domain-containing protein n=1 Tax=Parastrongyloides trichosuri TaxID=131310 RepID=A0A0N4ZYJ1_PARTI
MLYINYLLVILLAIIHYGFGQSCGNNMVQLANSPSCQNDLTCRSRAVGYFCYQGICCQALNLPSGSYGSSCSYNSQCTIANSECSQNICYCKSGYNFNGNSCQYGSVISNPIYDSNNCGYNQVSINNQCFQVVIYGQFCSYNEQCNYYGGVCSNRYCRCNTGLIYNGRQCVTDSDYPMDQPSTICGTNQVQINGKCYMKVSQGGACLYNEQCYTTNNIAMLCQSGTCQQSSLNPGIGGGVSPNGICQVSGATPEMVNGSYKNCLYTTCSSGYRCEYNTVVNGGQYICCGTSSVGGIGNGVYGQVKMYLNYNIPLDCRNLNSCTFTDYPYCVNSATYGHKVCCSTQYCA